MKANEIPKKLYIPFEDEIDIDCLNTYAQKGTYTKEIEYVRTDAFIEKVARFLENKLYDRVEIQVWGTIIPSLTSKKEFIEDFIKYMKGE